MDAETATSLIHRQSLLRDLLGLAAAANTAVVATLVLLGDAITASLGTLAEKSLSAGDVVSARNPAGVKPLGVKTRSGTATAVAGDGTADAPVVGVTGAANTANSVTLNAR